MIITVRVTVNDMVINTVMVIITGTDEHDGPSVNVIIMSTLPCFIPFLIIFDA